MSSSSSSDISFTSSEVSLVESRSEVTTDGESVSEDDSVFNEDVFRTVPIYPTVEDIRSQSMSDVSSIASDDNPESGVHYLSIQFNLLRQELVYPLAEDVNKVKVLYEEYIGVVEERDVFLTKKKALKKAIERELQTNVYFDVKLLDTTVDRYHGLVLKFMFDSSGFESIDLMILKECENLTPGSLLCLSCDGFHNSIFFGFVVDNNITKELKNRSLDTMGLKKTKSKETNPMATKLNLWFSLKLDFDNNENRDLFNSVLKPNTEYIAVESKTYYEGMRYSLARLQEIKDNFPLKRYIVDVNRDIKPPPYLKADTYYNMSCLSSETVKNKRLSPMRLLDANCKSSLMKSTTYEEKQLDAFYTGLTQELAVIQGPPGTGKTFIGQKIVKCLLDNRMVWNNSIRLRPILIVSYKNHALDHILERILNFNTNVVRIGGKTEKKAIIPYRLKNINSRSLCECNDRIQELNNSLSDLFKSIAISFEHILDLNDIKAYIKPKRFVNQLVLRGIDGNPKDVIRQWLSSGDEDFTSNCAKYLNRSGISKEVFDKVSKIRNDIKINGLRAEEKWVLYLFWREEYIKDKQKTLNVLLSSLDEVIDRMKRKKLKLQLMCCKGKEIIGLTITGATKYMRLVEALEPKIMIVEEAASVLEGQVVAAMPSTIEHLILIGDHKQLRPKVNTRHLSDILGKSLFERMVSNDMPYEQLELQYRMRPCIAELLKVADIYDNLRNDQRVSKYPNVKNTYAQNMFFIDHNHHEDNTRYRKIVDKSHSNRYEAKFVVELVKYFLLCGCADQKIAVLTTYNAQLYLIKTLMFKQKIFVKGVKNGRDRELPELRVRVSSVDGFQGEEKDIIIVSFVRSNDRGVIGFLGTMNRVNVSLSRARHGLYCVGNFQMMAEQSPHLWRKIVEHLQRNQCFGQKFMIGCQCIGALIIETPKDLKSLNKMLEQMAGSSRSPLCRCF